MNYGFLDIEMTCDGKIEDGKFIDDGRMKHSKREVISVGFVVCNDKYNIINTYFSFVKPVRNAVITDYCSQLTGITQTDVDHGKKCNNAFRDIMQMCSRYAIDYIFTFGDADRSGIINTARWNKKQKENVFNLFAVSKRIVDVKPAILKMLNFGNKKMNPGLSKITEMMDIKNDERHNALNDAIMLCEVCKKLKIQVNQMIRV